MNQQVRFFKNAHLQEIFNRPILAGCALALLGAGKTNDLLPWAMALFFLLECCAEKAWRGFGC
jgi:hypothetical protein